MGSKGNMKKKITIVLVIVILFISLAAGFYRSKVKFEPTDLGSAVIGSEEVSTVIVTKPI